jgi:hypothetical protein
MPSPMGYNQLKSKYDTLSMQSSFMNAVHGRARCENRPCRTLVMTLGRTFLFGPASVLADAGPCAVRAFLFVEGGLESRRKTLRTAGWWADVEGLSGELSRWWRAEPCR